MVHSTRLEQGTREEANNLQQELIAEMKANNEATSKHNTVIKRLTIAIVVVGILTVVLGILTIWANYNQTGRYAFFHSPNNDYDIYVLDTKTSQLWRRAAGAASYYKGTNVNLKNELKSE